ncbi:MAG TPA: hypothetical protein VNT51_01005 [Miltoncostaeaceae bacterium]|nr:hypothetical protein [Miltoncostaeaceae bacterium]
MSPLVEIVARDLPPLVDRRRLLRLGLTESTVDHVWRRVPLVRAAGDTKSYASREDVLAVLQEVRR